MGRENYYHLLCRLLVILTCIFSSNCFFVSSCIWFSTAGLALEIVFTSLKFMKNEMGHSISYKTVWAPSKDQPAQGPWTQKNRSRSICLHTQKSMPLTEYRIWSQKLLLGNIWVRKNIYYFYRNSRIRANNPFMEYLHRKAKNIHVSNRILHLSTKIRNVEYLLRYAKYN